MEKPDKGLDLGFDAKRIGKRIKEDALYGTVIHRASWKG